jgi:hypothetical protein
MYQYMQYGFEFFLAFSALCARDGGHRIEVLNVKVHVFSAIILLLYHIFFKVLKDALAC